MRLALGLYCVFIIYGSLIPFDFSFSAETAGHQLAKVHVLPFSGGQRVWSVADMASNIALFVPFGLLLAAARGHGQKPVRVLGLVTVASLAFGTAVESAQLFLPSRTASPVDVACETIGGIGGGFLALYWLRGGLAHAMLRGPLWSVLTVLAVALMVDRWYPFAATLDVSTAMQSLRHAQLVPFARWSPDKALDALVPQLIWPAFAGGVSSHLAARMRTGERSPAIIGAIACTLFLAALEAGKLVFAGRSPNVDNVMIGGIAALVGAGILPRLARLAIVSRHRAAWLIAVAVLLLAHAELTPYQFSTTAKLERLEWMPFASYYVADPRTALFDLGNKLLLSGFLGFAVALEWPSNGAAPVIAGIVCGVVLEAAQLFTLTRTASVSDVIIICLGSIFGAIVCRRYRS